LVIANLGRQIFPNYLTLDFGKCRSWNWVGGYKAVAAVQVAISKFGYTINRINYNMPHGGTCGSYGGHETHKEVSAADSVVG